MNLKDNNIKKNFENSNLKMLNNKLNENDKKYDKYIFNLNKLEQKSYKYKFIDNNFLDLNSLKNKNKRLYIYNKY